MKNKFDIGEILATRKLGTLGKHSTLEDVISLLGDPSIITNKHNNSNYFLNYGDLGIEISGVKKRIISILISNYNGPTKRTFKFGKNKIIRDWSRFVKLDRTGIRAYLLKYNIPTYEYLYLEGISLDILPVQNKYFTKDEPRFNISFNLKTNTFRCITILYNYRSKKRD